jgi:hypothetical protein
MAFGNNRAATQTKSFVQTAGGCIIKFRHPFLAGSIDTNTTGGAIDEIDVSSSLKLAETFLSAQPNQDSSSQVILVDGSTVAITNHILNGTLSLPVIRTTGKVSSGDFVAALQLIVSSKDSVGGTLIRTVFMNGEAHTRLYYGVTVKKIPHDIIMGLDVPVYQCELYYSGFIDSISESSDLNMRTIWAVGSKSGVQGIFKPYEVSKGSTKNNPMDASNVLGQGTVADDTTGDFNLNTDDADAEKIKESGYAYVDSSSVVQPYPKP